MREVSAELGFEGPDTVRVTYRVLGDLERLRIPRADTLLDPERLWGHTCGELFVTSGGETYVEWNFSPTGQAACFAFSSYRRRAPSSGEVAAAVSVAPLSGELRLQARVPLQPGLADTVHASLTMVIEDAAGGLSYWAMRHPCEQPDFHHRGGFVLALSLSPAPRVLDDVGESP